jgi:hypothetical protein
MKLKASLLALILVSLTVAALCLVYYKRAEAQVCAQEAPCSGGFPESCLPTPTTLPSVNIHVAGDWYTEELTGHCGTQDCYIILNCPCGPPRGFRLCTYGEKGRL